MTEPIGPLERLLRAFYPDWDQRLERAGGDAIEALHGHVCGPDCWHNQSPPWGDGTQGPEGQRVPTTPSRRRRE